MLWDACNQRIKNRVRRVNWYAVAALATCLILDIAIALMIIRVLS